jgi:predicted DCC family thiol-disulfide oxidoreductase YuxK
MHLTTPLRARLRNALRHRLARWNRFWFAPASALPLDVARIATGLALLGLYGGLGANLFALYADGGWVDRAAASELRPGAWSVLFWLPPGWPQHAVLTGFVLALLAFTLGAGTRWAKWLVWLGHLSLLHRNPAVAYGVDNIAASVLLLLALAPIGRHVSIDRWLAVRQARRAALDHVPAVSRSARARWVLRLLQLQMALFFLVAGAAKLQGDSWWHGLALWYAINNHEYANLPVRWLAEQFWLVNLLTYGTVVLELAYPFLVWGRARGALLLGAIALHVGIAVFLGLYAFSLLMIGAHIAFGRERWWAAAAAAWRARFGGLEMIYDGHCAFCKRSMAGFLAFDGLRQIAVRDFRAAPSPIVPDAALEKALYLVTPDGRALPGFEAYRHAVLRVPGLWWMVPAFCIPWLSRAVGTRVYGWIASHRHVISDCGLPGALACALPAQEGSAVPSPAATTPTEQAAIAP